MIPIFGFRKNHAKHVRRPMVTALVSKREAANGYTYELGSESGALHHGAERKKRDDHELHRVERGAGCPLTKETRNMIDAEAFKRMRKGTRFINIARGEIVDEKALIEALRSGHLAGAALDAHIQEPLPADSPLWDLPDVIVTPHNAAASTGNERRSAEMFIANFGHWLRGGDAMFNVQRV